MLYIQSLTATSFDVNSITLSWSWKETGEDFNNYTLDVLKSETPVVEGGLVSGSYGVSGYYFNDQGTTIYASSGIVVTGLSPLATFSYTDTSVSGLLSKWRDIHYKLKIVSTTSPDVYTLSDPVRLEVKPDFQALEMVRRKKLGLNKLGKDFVVLKRKTYGNRCTSCWDPTLYRRNKEDCSNCYDTGWDGGYFDPIKIKGSVAPVTEQTRLTPYGEWNPAQSIFATVNYPVLQNKDIIVDSINRRFRVDQVVPTEKAGALIAQRAQVTMIDKTDIIYSYSVEAYF